MQKKLDGVHPGTKNWMAFNQHRNPFRIQIVGKSAFFVYGWAAPTKKKNVAEVLADKKSS